VPVHGGVYNYLTQDQKAVDGSIANVDGYMPLRHADQLMEFIDTPSNEPFFGLLGWVAPHDGSPADRTREPASPYVYDEYRGTYDGAPLPPAPSFDERRVRDKRQSIQERPGLSKRVVRRIRYVRAQRRESLMAVDEKVAELVGLLASRGELDETYIVLTSDNGWMEGQHRIPAGKLQAYEESAAVPLIIRGPGFAPGTKYRGLTGLQDLVPTILDVTGTQLPATAPEPDGVSLADLVSGELVTPRPQLIEIADNSRTHRARISTSTDTEPIADPPWFAHGVVTGDRWKYVEYPGTQEVEMYDLERDPHELRNLANRPAYATERELLRQVLRAYQSCQGVACRA
jgi:arylsulfatase A-like enzyme